MRRLLLFLLAALSLVACTQNEVEELTANRADAPETLTVGFEGADDETRVQLQNGKTVWTKGDEVSVFYFSNANQRWQFQGETGERMGKLKRLESAEATAETTYNVVAYPYDSSYFLNPRTCALHATLPATQHYAVDSYGAGGNIMVAQSEFTQFSLRNVCGWLRIDLTGESEVVESVKVRGNNGEQVAGLISVDTATAEATLAAEMGEASDEEQVGGVGGGLEFDDTVFTEVTLDCGDGVELGAEATEFYVALLPQTFEKGMTVEVDYSNGNSQTLVCENSITISRNHISPIESEANVEVEVPTNQLWYTATALVEPNSSAFNVAIVSNEWDEATGEGIITFYGELTEIGDVAFDYCTSLTSVTIPDSVTTIGDWAFGHCYSLTSVTIGDSVTTIGDFAFCDCSSLTSVTVPDSVTTIGDLAFCVCSSLTSVTIGDSVTTIGASAFSGCSNLAEFKGKFAADGGRCLIVDGVLNAFAIGCGAAEYTIPDSVMTIGDGAFHSCYSLTSITIPESVTTIGTLAFAYCDDLTSVTIPDSVTTIGNEAFYQCHSLTSVYITDVATWCNISFDGSHFSNPLTNGADLYLNNELVTDLTIPDSVTWINHYAFYGCDSLTSVVIPNSVTTIGIGDYAFYGCDSLTSVTILDSVTWIGYAAFAHCSNLISVYCKAIIPPTLGDSTVFDSNADGRKIYVYEECVDIYKAAWSEYADSIVAGGNIPESVTTTILYTTSDGAVIDASKFPVKSHTYNNGVGELILYGELTTIPYEVFRNYDTLTTIIIPESVTTIGWYAFYGCECLTSVTIPESITSIVNRAFENCGKLSEFKGKFAADDGRCLIKDNTLIAYANASGTKYTIPDSVTSIGDFAFFDCDSLTSITIPESVTMIGDHAFNSCESLTSVTIGDSVTTIGNEAFRYCTSLTSVTIPDSVTTIGGAAFCYCSSLTSVYCEATTPPTLGGSSVFDDNASGRKIYVPAESVEEYKAADGWSEYAADIVGYDFE